MEQSGVDMMFWDTVQDTWSELPVKPVVMEELLRHGGVCTLANRIRRQDAVIARTLSFVRRELRKNWDLSSEDVDRLVSTRIAMDEAAEAH